MHGFNNNFGKSRSKTPNEKSVNSKSKKKEMNKKHNEMFPTIAEAYKDIPLVEAKKKRKKKNKKKSEYAIRRLKLKLTVISQKINDTIDSIF